MSTEERDTTVTHEAAADQAAAPEPVPAEAAAPGEEPAGAERPDEAAPVAPEPAPDYKDQWLRAAAELDNVRKRAKRDVAVAESRGIAKLAKELLPALDNFERAQQQAAAAGNGASADGASEATEEAEEDVVDAEVVDEGKSS